MRPDSGGPGKYRGGLGCACRSGLWKRGDGACRRTGATPIRRGACGAASWAAAAPTGSKTPEDQEWKPTGIYRLPVTKQTVIRAETTGGGGWGDPLDRDPQMVLTDFLNGYISKQGARDDSMAS